MKTKIWKTFGMFFLLSGSIFAQDIDGEFETNSSPWNGGVEKTPYASDFYLNWSETSHGQGVSNTNSGRVGSYISYGNQYGGSYLYHDFPFQAGTTYHIQLSLRNSFYSEYGYRATSCGNPYLDSEFKILATSGINGTTKKPTDLTSGEYETLYNRYIYSPNSSMTNGRYLYPEPYQTLNFVYTPTSTQSQLLFTLYNNNLPVAENILCAWDLTSIMDIDNISITEYKGNWGTLGSSSGAFNSPVSVATDVDGNIYVTDSNNWRIQKFTSTGTFITSWGGYGTADGKFINPSSITIDKDGYVYVGDGSVNGSRIQKFSRTGQFITKWGSYGSGQGQFKRIHGLSSDQNGFIYATDHENHRVQKFNSAGAFVMQFGTYGTGNGQLNGPTGIAVDRSGNVFICDRGNNRIQKFNSNGSFLQTWGSYGNQPGNFNQPFQITTDKNDNLYVADPGNNRFQKFNRNGVLLQVYGNQESSIAQFNYPVGIAISASNNLYVANLSGNNIKRFKVTGNCVTCNTLRTQIEDKNTGVVTKDLIEVFPNPSEGDINISSRNNDSFKFTVIDVLGQTVLKKEVSGNSHTISDGTLSQGTYLLQINSNDEIQTLKVVVK